ncbi:hypothetical protein MP228_012408 [Amoeboaphelidium protococcarum]|nr:hypothetical protein MP228_012408 [Amoeboaphelidium protococcarum]
MTPPNSADVQDSWTRDEDRSQKHQRNRGLGGTFQGNAISSSVIFGNGDHQSTTTEVVRKASYGYWWILVDMHHIITVVGNHREASLKQHG